MRLNVYIEYGNLDVFGCGVHQTMANNFDVGVNLLEDNTQTCILDFFFCTLLIFAVVSNLFLTTF